MSEQKSELRQLMQSKSRELKGVFARLSSSGTAVSIWAYSKLALAGMLVALLMVFSVQNANNIQVRFLVWETQMSQALVVFSALLSGVVFGVALNSWLWWRSSRKQRNA